MRSPKGKGSALAANDVSRTAGAMMSLELTARGSGGARVRRGTLRRLRAAPPARHAARGGASAWSAPVRRGRADAAIGRQQPQPAEPRPRQRAELIRGRGGQASSPQAQRAVGSCPGATGWHGGSRALTTQCARVQGRLPAAGSSAHSQRASRRVRHPGELPGRVRALARAPTARARGDTVTNRSTRSLQPMHRNGTRCSTSMVGMLARSISSGGDAAFGLAARLFPPHAPSPHAQGSSGDVATVPFAWRGHTKSLTTRARPGPDLAVWLE